MSKKSKITIVFEPETNSLRQTWEIIDPHSTESIVCYSPSDLAKEILKLAKEQKQING